jgi:hypothetical protein
LSTCLDEVVLDRPCRPQVGVGDPVGGPPELDVCDDVGHRERVLLGCPPRHGALGLDVSPNLSNKLGDQCVSGCQVGTPLRAGHQLGGYAGKPGEWARRDLRIPTGR